MVIDHLLAHCVPAFISNEEEMTRLRPGQWPDRGSSGLPGKLWREAIERLRYDEESAIIAHGLRSSVRSVQH
ncbi:hypothetical protein Shyhy01_21240 [Streptomyces hygroscopicus subsp. hygroscopicus]|nr:hypothetical protein Shyhy01_21240 [Streptomyces hygroscopicus subsp. hygroscopicus]